MYACACARTHKTRTVKMSGGKKVMPSILFFRTIITIIMKFTYIMGTSFMKLRLFFHKVSSFTVNKLFPPLRETLYASHIKLCAEELWALIPMSFSLLLK